MRKIIFSILIFSNYTLFAQIHKWVCPSTNNPSESQAALAVTNSQGSAYSTGHVKISPTANSKLVITKSDINCSGSWNHILGDPATDQIVGTGIAVNDKHVYVIGDYCSDLPTVSFDDGVNPPFILDANPFPMFSMFILKLDKTNGNILWAQGVGNSTSNVSASAIDLLHEPGSSDTKLYVNGTFKSPSSPGLEFGSSSIPYNSGLGTNSAFVAKYIDDDITNTVSDIWVAVFNGQNSTSYSGGSDVSARESGSQTYIFSGGIFKGDCKLPIDLKTSSLGGLYVSRILDNGTSFSNSSFTVQFGSSTNADKPIQISADHSCGGVYVTGAIAYDNCVFPGLTTLTLMNPSKPSAFVCYINQGAAFTWANEITGNGKVKANPDIATSEIDDVYITCSYEDELDMDPDASLAILALQPIPPSLDALGSFVTKWNSNGEYRWAEKFNGASNICISIGDGPSNDIYMAGTFGTAEFELISPPVVNATGIGSSFVNVINYDLDPSSSPIVLDLKCYIQGYYLNGGMMDNVAFNQTGNPALIGQVGEVVVNLRKTTFPFNIVNSYSYNPILHTNGIIDPIQLPNSVYLKDFYVEIFHAGCPTPPSITPMSMSFLPTWTASPINFSTSINYDFSTSAAQAFGSNQIDVDFPPTNTTFGFYSGDLCSTDCNVDLLDITTLEISILAFASGALAEDLNGDGNVDLLDLVIMELNVLNFVSCVIPNSCLDH